jgi:hypothetical protein
MIGSFFPEPLKKSDDAIADFTVVIRLVVSYQSCRASSGFLR